MKTQGIIFGFTLLLSTSFQLSARQTNDFSRTKKEISADIKSIMKQDHIPGAAIALVNEHGLIWSKSFGYADVKHKTKVTEHTLFNVGPITQVFTTVAVLQMEEQKRTGLDQAYNYFVPDLGIGTRNSDLTQISIRHLLAHYSGMPSDYLENETSETPMDMAEMLSSLSFEYLAFPPEYVYCMSNLAYELLGILIERGTTDRYEGFLHASVLQPLQMNESGFTNETAFIPKLAKQYEDGNEVKFYGLRDVAAEGFCSSTYDLSQFAADMLNTGGSKILTQDHINQMFAPQYQDAELNLDFVEGLGWNLRGLNVNAMENLDYIGNVASQGGSNQFFSSKMMLAIDQHLGIIVLMNSNSPDKPADDIAVKLLEYAAEEKTGIKKPVVENFFNNNSANDSLDLSGSYATQWGFMQIHSTADNGYEAEAMGMKFQLDFFNPKRAFHLKYESGSSLPFNADELTTYCLRLEKVASQQVLAIYKDGLRDYFGKKISGTTISDKWVPRIGSYSYFNAQENPKVIDHLSISQEQDFLILQMDVPYLFRKAYQVAIYPLDDNKAYIMGNGTSTGDILKFYEKHDRTFLQYEGITFAKDI